MAKTKNRLSYKNDWESHLYSVNGKLIKKLKSVVIHGMEYPVKTFKDTVRYNDMGNESSATSNQFSIEMQLDPIGITISVTLNELLRKKVAIEAKGFE